MPAAASRGEWLERLLAIARQAGETILQVYATNFAVEQKSDRSPVTEADRRAEAVILPALATLAPHIPVISEETSGEGTQAPAGDRFWLVDPLDGTKEFIQRNGEFTVNIALIEGNRPVLGVVYAPALARLYAGVAGSAAFAEDANGRRPIACRPPPADGLTVVASRSHGDTEQLDRFLAGFKIAGRTNAGSSLKFCLVAAGEADLYPRFGRTMEWDTAAGHAVLAAAGGRVTTVDGKELLYGKPGLDNPHFIARGR